MTNGAPQLSGTRKPIACWSHLKMQDPPQYQMVMVETTSWKGFQLLVQMKHPMHQLWEINAFSNISSFFVGTIRRGLYSPLACLQSVASTAMLFNLLKGNQWIVTAPNSLIQCNLENRKPCKPHKCRKKDQGIQNKMHSIFQNFSADSKMQTASSRSLLVMMQRVY